MDASIKAVTAVIIVLVTGILIFAVFEKPRDHYDCHQTSTSTMECIKK